MLKWRTRQKLRAASGEPEEGAVVEAPAVFAEGAPGAYSMSPAPESGDEESGEGAGIRDEDVLLGGEKEADNVAAVAEGEARLAAAAGAAAAAPAAAAGP